MSPTRRSISSRFRGVCLAALLSATPGLARAQDAAPATFNTASWVLIFVAFCLALALVRQSRARQAETARADLLADELDRERALVETSPEAIICWDTGSGEQKLSDAAARILGCTISDPVSADTIAALAVDDERAGLQKAVSSLISDGVEFHSRFDATGDKRFELSGRAMDQDGGKPLAVLWLRDDTSAAIETADARRIGDGFRKLLDSFPFPVWRRGRWLDFEYVNPAYREAVEAPADTHPDSVPELPPARCRTADGRSPPVPPRSAMARQRHITSSRRATGG